MTTDIYYHLQAKSWWNYRVENFYITAKQGFLKDTKVSGLNSPCLHWPCRSSYSRNLISPLWRIKLQSIAKYCNKYPEKQMHIQDKTMYLFRPQRKRWYFQIISHQLELHLNFMINTTIHMNCNRIPNDSKTRPLTESYPVDSASGLLDNSFTGLKRWQVTPIKSLASSQATTDQTCTC